MATIALSRPVAPHRASTMTSSTTTITLEPHAPPPPRPVPVPNKHIPVCPPGPIPNQKPTTPPPSPQNDDEAQVRFSLLYPPDRYPAEDMGPLRIYKLDADHVAAAVDHLARQPLPDPARVFPWLHGLHPSNPIQQAFFMARKRSQRRTPSCLRGITIVKADGDLSVSRLKGAIAPQEFLQLAGPSGPEFLDVDPKEGFSVRNFHIQPAKSAMTSDIIVYGTDDHAVRKLAWNVASAQERWRERHDAQRHPLPRYNTFICVSPFSEFERRHPHLVSIDSAGLLTGQVLDFFHQERREMYEMTRASETSCNVWLGPTPESGSEEEQAYDILIECADAGRLNPAAFHAIASLPDDETKQYHLDFPSSGSIMPPSTASWSSHNECDAIVETCRWIYYLSHGLRPEDLSQPLARPRKILLHCADGYTETTLLAVAYHSFITGQPVPEAWLDLHVTRKRNMFAYPSDVALLSALAPRLLLASPMCPAEILRMESEAEVAAHLQRIEPRWFAQFDGSFPSRVLEHMYLGNLGHANNPDLLRAIGVGQMLSVGETAMWRDGELEEWGEENVCLVRGVQDNGIDGLSGEFERCLGFIDRGLARKTATLVHCRVGVSRSATICIAEVMRRKRMSFPRAYCFVRARRLNVIIQPHLRFAYELLKWEERILSESGVQQNGEEGKGEDCAMMDAEAEVEKGCEDGVHCPPPSASSAGAAGEEGCDDLASSLGSFISSSYDTTSSGPSSRSSSISSVSSSGGGGFKRELEWAEIAREIALMNRPYTR